MEGKMTLQTKSKKTQGRELVITRVFDTPREAVWNAWTDPETMKKWWGPRDFTMPVCQIDLRVGGDIFYSMRAPDGKDMWGKGKYLEIKKPERLVITDSFADEKGNIVPASHYGMSVDFPLELLVTVIFEQEGGKTRMTLKHTRIAGLSDIDFDNMRQGWEQSFDKLVELLAKK
jgi:uncharacterized protein YndB with AHSA1/START domain